MRFAFNAFLILITLALEATGVKLVRKAAAGGKGKVSVFGATGGLGQWSCRYLLNEGYDVHAITRDKFGVLEALSGGSSSNLELLRGCKLVEANARDLDDALIESVRGANSVIISLGTTAFPTKKWDGGNYPYAACVDTVINICDALEASETVPDKLVLLSSIGVERTDKPPFSILNLFGVLDAKLESEQVLLQRGKEMGAPSTIVVRPGRLVGAPFTNTDLAKLLKMDQGTSQGLILDTREVLAGDVERKDVANIIVRLINEDGLPRELVFSIINKSGPAPSEYEWGKLLSIFTTPGDQFLTTRET